MKKNATSGNNRVPVLWLLFLALTTSYLFFAQPFSPNSGTVEASSGKTLGDLTVGDLVVDNSWRWEFRTAEDYRDNRQGVLRPVVWIVVAKDHYGQGSGVTLLTEELIVIPALSLFNSYDYWQESGARHWLNSTRDYSGVGFYHAFSENFKRSILTTTKIPNVVAKSPFSSYNSTDRVFIPSTTELGDTAHAYTRAIGTTYPYFSGGNSAGRQALANGTRAWYWTRSPRTSGDAVASNIILVDPNGIFTNVVEDTQANRPAVNVDARTPVTAAPNAQGVYEITGLPGDTNDNDGNNGGNGDDNTDDDPNDPGNGDDDDDGDETTPPESGPGDVNGDGRIDVQDAVLTMRYAMGFDSLSAGQQSVADVNGDGRVDVVDVVLIMRKALGLIDKFPGA